MSYEPPLKITIPIPSVFPNTYGPHSTGKRGGNLRVRCTNGQYDAIQKEASLLGITLAMFCRWSAVHVADMLREHRETASTNISVGDDDEPRHNKRGNTGTSK
jgi:hypothetical protein